MNEPVASKPPGVGRLLQVAALILYVIAALGAFGWLIHEGPLRVLGFIAAGLACTAASRVGA